MGQNACHKTISFAAQDQVVELTEFVLIPWHIVCIYEVRSFCFSFQGSRQMANIVHKSEALRANMLETHSVHNNFSEKELFLLEIVAPFPMVTKRLTDYLKEKHHRFPDLDEIVEGYRWIILENLWSFMKHPEREKIFICFADELVSITLFKLNQSQLHRLINTSWCNGNPF